MKIILHLFVIIAVQCYTAAQTNWWKTVSLYQIFPRSFKDSDGDGIGDLKGITDKLEHLVDAKVDAFWLSPIYPSPMVDMGYDITNFTDIEPTFGTLDDFDKLLEKAHKLRLKVLLDFVPNHTSDEHEWFQKSVKNIPPYNDYYVWANGTVNEDGTISPPNNWLSRFGGGSAWEWNNERQAYYLHQFSTQQPDLNFRNEGVVEEMKNVLRFWIERGVDGFRGDAPNFLFEDVLLRDEPTSGQTNDTNDYFYLDHIYTTGQPELYDMVQQWRNVVDEYKSEREDDIIIVIEAYTSTELTMKYYDYGAHFPFNFWFITRLDENSSPSDLKHIIDEWMTAMPKGGVANWQVGNHDRKRIVTRFGAKRAQGLIAATLLLPGAGVTYYGDEIGMPENHVSWKETTDPQGCNIGEKNYQMKSRDPSRTPFLWDDTTSAGFSTNSHTWLPVNPDYKMFNLNKQKEAPDSEFKFYQAITSLREMPVVQNGHLNTYALNEKIFAFSRTTEDDNSAIYVVINFRNESENIDLTEKIPNLPDQLIIYRTSMGSNFSFGDKIDPKSATIPAEGTVIYTTQ